MKQRGQAALEFITTYGWAILVVMVMIGALAYFGVLNPNKYLPEKCIFSAGFNCKDFAVQDNSGNLKAQFKLENKAGDTIQLLGIVANTTKGATGYGDTSCATSFPVNMSVDATQSFTCTFGANSGPGVGQQAKVNVQLSYKLVTGTYTHIVNGLIQAQAQ